MSATDRPLPLPAGRTPGTVASGSRALGAEVAGRSAAGPSGSAAAGFPGRLDPPASDPGLGLGLAQRPWYRRALRPAIGATLVLVGLVLWILPVVPGFFLAVIGAPMVLGFWPRREARLRRRLVDGLARVGLRWKRRRTGRVRGLEPAHRDQGAGDQQAARGPEHH